MPQASRLGLRYVAHVVQTDRQTDILPVHLPASILFELQIFQDLTDARQWLRRCRDADAWPAPGK